MVRARKSSQNAPPLGKSRRPWFIAGFLASAALVTFVPELRDVGRLVSDAAHRLLAVTLLIGLGLSRPALRALGLRPLIQGVVLWLALGSVTLVVILCGWLQ